MPVSKGRVVGRSFAGPFAGMLHLPTTVRALREMSRTLAGALAALKAIRTRAG
jgi:hypothetical protein